MAASTITRTNHRQPHIPY